MLYFCIIVKPIKHLVTWYAYLKMSNLGDIPYYDGAGHIFTNLHELYLLYILYQKSITYTHVLS